MCSLDSNRRDFHADGPWPLPQVLRASWRVVRRGVAACVGAGLLYDGSSARPILAVHPRPGNLLHCRGCPCPLRSVSYIFPGGKVGLCCGLVGKPPLVAVPAGRRRIHSAWRYGFTRFGRAMKPPIRG